MTDDLENIDFANMPNDKRNEFLRRFWHVPENSPFEIFGQLNCKRSSDDKNDIYFIDHVCNSEIGTLTYPDSKAKFTIFVGQDIDEKLKSINLSVGNFIIVKLDLLDFYPNYEQQNIDSCFHFKVNVNDLSKLVTLPNELLVTFAKKIDNKVLVEEWIIENKSKEIIDIEEKKQKLLDTHQLELSKLKEKLNKVLNQKKTLEKQLTDKSKIIQDKINKLNSDLTLKQTSIKQIDEVLLAKNEALEHTEEDLKLKRKSLNQIEEDLKLGRDTLKQLNESKKQIISDMDQISKERSNIVEKINSTILESKNMIQNSITKINLLVSLGLINIETVKNVLDVSILFNSDAYYSGTFEDSINVFHSYLLKHGAFYKKSLIRNFCALLNTHDLIFLAGDSGIGKTNLVKRMAEALGGVAKIIPVKPNWTSSEDLLGYYNPIEKRYISTPFLDAILEAGEHTDKLYLICLDEMNLARIEYYFADFLSKLEERNDYTSIELYSEHEEQALSQYSSELFDTLLNNDKLKKILSEYNIENEKSSMLYLNFDYLLNKIDDLDTKENFLKLRKILKFKSSIPIPSNIRFIGTLNVDDTTYYLSPKIIDRAHILKFENPLFINKSEVENELINTNDTIANINPCTFFEIRTPYPNFIFEKEHEKLVTRLIELSKKMSDIGMGYGARVVNQAILYSRSMKKFGEMDDDVIFNNIMLQKIYPRLVFDASDPANTGDSKNKMDILESIIIFLKETLPGDNDNIICIKELERMINVAKNGNNQINYWIK